MTIHRLLPSALLALLLILAFPVLAQDQDGDGMPDSYELAHPCLNVAVPDGNLDPDNDGMTSLQEYQYSTSLDPCNPDTDGDGLPDGWEVQYQSCGFDPVSNGTEIITAKIGADLLVTNTPCDSWSPSLSWTGSEFGVTLYDDRYGYYEIYFARVSSAGAKIGADVRLTNNPNWSTAPSLSWTGSEFGVSWTDSRDSNDEIYFARVSSTGAKIGADIRITSAPGNSHTPSLTWTGSEFGVSWMDLRDGGSYEVYFARISPGGGKIGTDLRVTNAPGHSEYPSLSWTGSEFGVSWGDARDGGLEVYFARISSSGAKIGTDLRVTNAPSSSDFASLVWTGSEFGVSWEDRRDGNDEIYFARISASAEKIGDDLRVTRDPSYSHYPSLAWTGYEFGLSWMDARDHNYEIYFVRISAVGEKIGADFRVTADSGDSDMPSLAWTGSEYGVSWYDTPKIKFARFTNHEYTDKDTDGLRDDHEYALGTDPCDPDTDGDGLSDGYEVNTSHTNPLNWDSDGDRLPDGFEVVNGGHGGGGLDPMNPADGAADYDGDGNSNANEYWNGSDPWTMDPVPGQWDEPGCFYWGDGDGDGVPSPVDVAKLRMEIAGVGQTYGGILPHTAETLDLDRDGTRSPLDLTLMRQMVAGAEMVSGYPSQAASLSVESAPTGSVAVGSTTHVTVSVHSASGEVPYAPGFGVVFEVVSGNAVLLGGDGNADGEAAGNRYDVSMEAASGAKANMVVLVTGAGPVTIGAKIPGCGTAPYGRWNDEVVLSPEVVINP